MPVCLWLPLTTPFAPLTPLPQQLWEEMRREGCRPNVVTYNALIGACAQGEADAKKTGGPCPLVCSQGGHCRPCVRPRGHCKAQLCAHARVCMRHAQCFLQCLALPRGVSASQCALLIGVAAIPPAIPPALASAAAGMWAKAAEAFEAMLASGCRPDAVTHSVLISAYERGGQWRRCLQVRGRCRAAAVGVYRLPVLVFVWLSPHGRGSTA